MCAGKTDTFLKVDCFSHWVLEQCGGKATVLDMQGMCVTNVKKEKVKAGRICDFIMFPNVVQFLS